MTIDIFTTDWTKARTKIAGWQKPTLSIDLFGGEASLSSASVEGLDVLKLTVRPWHGNGLLPLSQSYAAGVPTAGVQAAPPSAVAFKELSGVDGRLAELPYNMTWLQANPSRFDFNFELPTSVRCLGLGERFSDLNLRGATHTLFSTDNPHHNEHADMLYKSIPFLILEKGGKYTGLWLDSPAPQRYDLDTELTGHGKIELFSRLGFELYVFAETTLPELIKAFTALTGRAPLPPLWALGHQQCRWSYPDEGTIRDLIREFRARKIPCDTLVLDIDYMDEYRVFTHSKERFPNFDKLAAEAKAENFKLITIVDPGVKQDAKFTVYKEGVANGHFCKTAAGDVFVETVWPGLSAFPDFLQARTRQWWGDNLKFYIDHGIAGIWNDMNEPAMFNRQKPLPVPLSALPSDDQQLMLQTSPDGPVGHFEVRNLYGYLMSQATHEALLRHRPNQRPFVLTRSGSTGLQRYAAVWLGDNTSWYEHLQKSLPMLLNVGLSGVTFAGVDIGGFGGDTTPELLIRWYEMGIFYPFFRNHCALMGRAQEPFSFSPEVEVKIRHLIEARYRLLPYIKNLFWEHGRSGAPLMRPLVWHYPADERARLCDDQFMFGEDIMVAPVVRSNCREREIYFPAGRWHHFDFATGAKISPQVIEGGQGVRFACPLGTIPAFVREGAIIPLADIMQSTVDYDSSDITFYAFGKSAACVYFEDDGISLDYQRGAYGEWQLCAQNGAFAVTCAHKGLSVDKNRQYKFVYVAAGAEASPQSVTL
jgi:alpha-glucosidase